MQFLILTVFLILLAEGFAPIKFDHDFGGEKFLRDSKVEEKEDGSGEDPDDVLITSTVLPPTVANTSANPPVPPVNPVTVHPIVDPTVHTTHLTTTTTITTPAKPINCYDVSKRCAAVKALCTRDEYKHIMMRQCARTCNLCPQFVRLPHKARCRDSFHSCPIWARNGFCHSTYYTLEERATYCPKSCEAC